MGEGQPDAQPPLELKAVTHQVNALKEQVFRAKARLYLLKEAVLHSIIAASRVIIRHKDDMGDSFRLVRLLYVLDGQELLSESDDSGALDSDEPRDIFEGSLTPGDHTLSVHLQYRGHGYGVFSYLEGYTFDVKSSHTFTVVEGEKFTTHRSRI